MNNIIKIFSLIAPLFFTTIIYAGKGGEDPNVEKNKSYTKSYTVGNDKVVLENSFGELQINTWGNDEIKVDVSITVKAADEKTAQQILDEIKIIDHKRNGEIYFKTEIGNDKENREVHHHENEKGDKHNDENFKVNYVVYMPSAARLHATNSFGKLSVGDYNGPLVLDSKFGTLQAGKLKQPENVTVEFGSGIIERVNGGKVTIKFGQGEIRNMSGDMDVLCEFDNNVKINLSNEVKSLHLKSNYGSVSLNVPQNLSAQFEIKSSMGNFMNRTTFAIKEDNNDGGNEYGPKMDKRYSGKAGGGSTNVHIDNEFGKVTLAHDVSFDGVMKKKGKQEE